MRPPREPDTQSEPKRLDSWKEIADYLGHDISTAMRWEKEGGLPVHRVPGGRGRSVFAYAADIDQWLAGQEVSPAKTPAMGAGSPTQGATGHRRFWLPLGLGALLLLVVAIGFATWTIPDASAEVASARLVGAAIVGFDRNGGELWRFAPPEFRDANVKGVVRVAEAQPGERPAVLVAAAVWQRDWAARGLIMLVDGGGRLRWQQSLPDHFVFGAVDYGPEWLPDDLLVYRTAAGPRVAVALHHHTWWPAVVAVFDADGRLVGRFVNAGWIYRLATSRDGRYLLAAGVSNGHGGAALAVLDAANVDGASPADGGGLPVCSNCPAGVPRAYVVAPWSDVARPADTPLVVVHVAESGLIELRAPQRRWLDGPVPEVIVGLSPSLEVEQRTVSDSFAQVHDALERDGQLTHEAATCPWRTPPVRVWTPERGWREIR
jgi:hypothetical protein